MPKEGDIRNEISSDLNDQFEERYGVELNDYTFNEACRGVMNTMKWANKFNALEQSGLNKPKLREEYIKKFVGNMYIDSTETTPMPRRSRKGESLGERSNKIIDELSNKTGDSVLQEFENTLKLLGDICGQDMTWLLNFLGLDPQLLFIEGISQKNQLTEEQCNSLSTLIRKSGSAKYANLKKVVVEGYGWLAVALSEVFRDSITHTEGTSPLIPTPMERSNPLYLPLSHMGDWLEGYELTMITYYLLSIIPGINKVPEKIKLITSSTAALSFISMYELGITHKQQADPADILGGVLGIGIYLGAHEAVDRYKRRKYKRDIPQE